MLVFALVYALELRAKYNAVDRNLIFKNIEISDFSRKFLRIRSKFRDSEITQIDAQWPEISQTEISRDLSLSGLSTSIFKFGEESKC